MGMDLKRNTGCRRTRIWNGLRARNRTGDFILAGVVFAIILDPGQLAHAYLDPGTGGIILQMVLGGVAGVIVVGKLYWHQFVSLFRGNSEKPEISQETRPE